MMMINKPMFMNYFEDGNLLQHDKDKETFVLSKTDILGNFCLNQEEMEKLCKFIEMANDKSKVKAKLNGTILEVKIDEPKLKANINTLSIDNKPQLNLSEVISSFTINVDKLKIASAFSDKKGIRAVLNGVCVRNGWIMATDSFSAYKTPCEDTSVNLVINNSFINILKELKGNIKLETDGTKIWHKNENGLTYVGRLLNGTYPNLENIYNSIKNFDTAVLNLEPIYNIFALSGSNSLIGLTLDKFCINTSTSFVNSEFEGIFDFKFENEFWYSSTMLKLVLSFINDKKNVKLNFSQDNPTNPVVINDEFLILPVRKTE